MCLVDAAVLSLAFLSTYFVFKSASVPVLPPSQFSKIFGLAIIIYIFSFVIGGIYSRMWQFSIIRDFLLCYTLSMLAGIVFGLVSVLFLHVKIEFSAIFIIAASALLVGLRVIYHYLPRIFKSIINKRSDESSSQTTKTGKERVLLVGAGKAARLFLFENNNNPHSNMQIVCAVDDDKSKVGRKIEGIRICGTTENIYELFPEYRFSTILVAIPSLNAEDKQRILSICNGLACKIVIMDQVYDLITQGANISYSVHNIKVEQLLGREPIKLNCPRDLEYLHGKTVLVTGGGGSIGSEIVRQVACLEVKKIVVLDFYENSAYELEQELKWIYGEDLPLCIEIANVREPDKMDFIFSKHKPDVVFHAAAHKHVPLMEANPDEAVKNNVMGTYNVAQSAIRYKTERFIFISTDKAVSPTNVMGATKRCTEFMIQSFARENHDTVFSAVRFGNVLGSNGSVIPLFQKQIERGGPVIVTDPEVTRYFMTIPEAVSLVLKTGKMAKGGEIFILDMGNPVKIIDLAENMIRLAGSRPYIDIKIKFSGLRPGEKLHEELALREEIGITSEDDKFIIVNPLENHINNIHKYQMALFEAAENGDNEKILDLLHNIIPNYKKAEITDEGRRLEVIETAVQNAEIS